MLDFFRCAVSCEDDTARVIGELFGNGNTRRKRNLPAHNVRCQEVLLPKPLNRVSLEARVVSVIELNCASVREPLTERISLGKTNKITGGIRCRLSLELRTGCCSSRNRWQWRRL